VGVAIAIGVVVMIGIVGWVWITRQQDERMDAGAGADRESPVSADALGVGSTGTAGDAVRAGAGAVDAAGTRGVDHTVRDRAMHDDVRARILAAWSAATNGAATRGATGATDNDASPPASQLDPTYIRTLIRDEFLPMARDCYDQQLARTRDAAGRMTLRFVIMADEHSGGIVDDVQSEDRDAGDFDEAFGTCMRETMRTMVFRAPEGGGRITVRYPFVFARGDGG
jgi:hypothetical protein